MSDYRRAADLVLAALDLAERDRAAMLDRECGGDTALRREVDALLAAHTRAGDFLETPPDVTDLIDAPFRAGDHVGPYRILGLIGEGGMGIVYRAEDTRLGREVALKSITPRFTGDAEWRERLRREARAAAALTHPGVATVYALEEFDDRLYLATEYVAGETLRAALARGPFAEADVRHIGHQLADALAAAHDRGIVHRDLKPENVMRTPDGAVKILDFGLAHLDDAGGSEALQLTKDEAVMGTPAYMSPEQLRGEPAGPASDIFALGVMLAELSTGRHPFAGRNPATTAARALSAEPELGGVPAALTAIIATCLAKPAHARYHSAHELRAALDMSAPVSAPIRARAQADAFWWWQFHQGAANAFSVTLAVVLWTIRGWIAPLGPLSGSAIMLIGVAAGLAATSLRANLLFANRVYGADAIDHHRRVIPWIRTADLLEAAAVALAAVRLTDDHALATALLTASAVVLAIVSLVVEPATARAAKLD